MTVEYNTVLFQVCTTRYASNVIVALYRGTQDFTSRLGRWVEVRFFADADDAVSDAEFVSVVVPAGVPSAMHS